MLLNPQFIALLIAVVVAVIILGIGLAVVRLIWTRRIDLSNLLTEVSTDGAGRLQTKASLSRFQFLVFTFVVAGLYFVLSLETGYLIDVPNGTLMLLGISGVSYLGSKTISSGSTAAPVSRQAAPDKADGGESGNGDDGANAGGSPQGPRNRGRNRDGGQAG